MRIRFVVPVALTLMQACGFLDENPSARVGEDEIYRTEDGMEAAVFGCYRSLLNPSGPAASMQEFLQVSSGLDHWGYMTSVLTDEARRCSLDFTQYSQNTYGYTGFTYFYSCIARCNKLIEATSDSSNPVSPEYREMIEGEARLLRALSYYYLVRQYGDVPVYLKMPQSLEDGNAPRTPFWEVYGIIINDLTVAETQMCDYDSALTASGRCCKWAATALKASVWCTIASLLSSPNDNFWDTSKRNPDFSRIGVSSASDAYKLALATAEEVINNGPYRLADKYSDLFRWADGDDWNLSERIIVITNTPEVQSSYNFSALRSLPRYINSATDSNNNWGRFRPTRYLFQKWCETYPGTKGTGNASSVYVSSSDPRLDVSLYHTSYYRHDAMRDQSIYPASNAILVSTAGRVVEQPYFKKYYDPTYNGDSGRADFYVLRLAEMYLIAAEASAYLSESPGDDAWNKAFGYIEALHSRARATRDGAKEPKWEQGRFASRQALLDAIFWERMFEMIGEGHEYYDTHRFGAAWLSRMIAEPINDFLRLPEQAPFTFGGQQRAGYTTIFYGNDFQYETDPQLLRRSLLCAFPYYEIVYNSSLTEDDQNDYYIR